MIGWLKGHVIDKREPGKIVLDVQGVGYDVETSLPTFFQLETMNTPISLHIHTLVREDAFILYGFLALDERHLFIRQENAAMLTKLPGIGKKTAERLVVEMKDRLQDADYLSSHASTTDITPLQSDEAVKALEALGYKPQEASKIIQKLDDGQKSCEQLIREALQSLVVR